MRLLEGRWRALRAPAKPSHARRLDRVQTRMKKLESLRMDVDAQRRRWAVRARGQGSTARVCTHLVLCSRPKTLTKGLPDSPAVSGPCCS